MLIFGEAARFELHRNPYQNRRLLSARNVKALINPEPCFLGNYQSVRAKVMATRTSHVQNRLKPRMYEKRRGLQQI